MNDAHSSSPMKPRRISSDGDHGWGIGCPHPATEQLDGRGAGEAAAHAHRDETGVVRFEGGIPAAPRAPHDAVADSAGEFAGADAVTEEISAVKGAAGYCDEFLD
ncbi:hypothetical protein ASF54_06510 [Frondihabitans sp. Leaf304]|nr:hypothetical protein ASF54_06510 [Frondihabitans sp. Leaf304]